MGKKIDIYFEGKYICTTTQSKTCKQAKEKFINNPTWEGLKPDGHIGKMKIDNFNQEKIKCRFQK